LTSPSGDSENSLLYPSVGASVVLSDLVDLPSVITFAKLRSSWAQVGGGANDPYQLNLTYGTFGQGHIGNALGRINNNSIPNANLIPLSSTEFEIGADFRFMDNRIGLDVAYYTRDTENDILNAAVSPTSGYGSKTVNVGRINNSGVELLLTLAPVKTAKFDWDLSLNYSNNQNEVVQLLTEEADEETLRVGESRTRNAYIQHTEGLPYSQIYGFSYARDASGNILLDDATGLAQQGEFMPLGTGVHPNTLGFRNSFRIGDVGFSFLLDMKTGGSIYNATNAYAYLRGLHLNTLEGREGGVGKATAEDYYSNLAFSVTEEFVQSADFMRLREIVLNYDLPRSVMSNLPIEGIGFSVSARNVALLWSKTDNIDPESTFDSGNAQGLEMFGVPRTRSFNASLNVRF